MIHGGPVLHMVSGSRSGVRSRVDAVVATRRFVVAVESKLGRDVDEEQIERHRELLGIPANATGDVTWSHLARVARMTREGARREPVARFVLEEFEEYLRMNGFGGLNEEHLSYFARQPEHRDELVKEGIRRALDELMIELAGSWRTDWRVHRPGNIQRDAAEVWAKLQPDRSGHSPHLSVGINPSGLDIFANIENEGPYRRFRRAWERDPGGLIALLGHLGSVWPPSDERDPPWRFSVVRRIPTGRPRTDVYWPTIDVVVAALATWPEDRQRWFLEAGIERPTNEHVPEVRLVRSYPSRVIIDDDHLASRLAADAAQLEQFFDWLGEPVRRTG